MVQSITKSIYRFVTPEAVLEFVEQNLYTNQVLIYHSSGEGKFCVTGMIDIPLIGGEVQIYKGHASALKQELIKLNF